MTEATAANVGAERVNEEVPPAGTAIVRPLRQVHAVRERCLQRFTGPAELAASCLARAW